MSDIGYNPLSVERPLVEREERGGQNPGPPRQASGPTVLHTNDPRFNSPSPSPLKRAALLLFVFCLFWFAFRLRTMHFPRPSPIESERFPSGSDYRPAVDFERIKDTRTRSVGRKSS